MPSDGSRVGLLGPQVQCRSPPFSKAVDERTWFWAVPGQGGCGSRAGCTVGARSPPQSRPVSGHIARMGSCSPRFVGCPSGVDDRQEPVAPGTRPSGAVRAQRQVRWKTLSARRVGCPRNHGLVGVQSAVLGRWVGAPGRVVSYDRNAPRVVPWMRAAALSLSRRPLITSSAAACSRA